MTALTRRCAQLSLLFILALAWVQPARAIDGARVDAFLEVTGFDVAVESIKLSAGSAPEMIGVETEDFGAQWTGLVDEVFDEALMLGLAHEILSATIDEEMLTHAMGFYGSDLGKRLVETENASHMVEDDVQKSETGDRMVADMVREGDPRLEQLKALISAIGSEDASVRAIQEVQLRFLMAAAGAGVVELQMDEADLREAMRSDEVGLRLALQTGALSNAAYTYEDFSDAEIAAYTEALEHPVMQRTYELMNAVQFEIMANRFEALAARLQSLSPSQEL
ncbi:DUF2059 domain-containing protein [Sulfitobacter sp. D35]|uniref:DUF2059 domain-containing protein n=1 Tax=Sulfitobacter sp. D35 TaxID=3083252 RepID=UPI00296F75E2|nr:DUF2059 domain-containing protein [Sulfitobacter sp. D35]MDW4496554.1 DUF2059 domain-containing protein [Sulfitobacter sp. D35]